MDVGLNLALFIFRPQILRCFSEKDKTGILANQASDCERGLISYSSTIIEIYLEIYLLSFSPVSYTHLTLPTIYSV